MKCIECGQRMENSLNDEIGLFTCGQCKIEIRLPKMFYGKKLIERGIETNNKVEIIKGVRAVGSTGLKEAKNITEAFLDSFGVNRHSLREGPIENSEDYITEQVKQELRACFQPDHEEVMQKINDLTEAEAKHIQKRVERETYDELGRMGYDTKAIGMQPNPMMETEEISEVEEVNTKFNEIYFKEMTDLFQSEYLED